MVTYPARFVVGEIFIDTSTRKTLKVARLVGSSQIELQDIGYQNSYESEVVDIDFLKSRIAAGSIKRL
jgi:hypothetical protein